MRLQVVDVLFNVSPYVMPAAGNFFQSVTRSPVAIQQLFPGLVKLYTGKRAINSSRDKCES